MVETMFDSPPFQRNSVPGATGPLRRILVTVLIHLGQLAKSVRTSQTVSTGAEMWISADSQTGAFRSMSVSATPVFPNLTSGFVRLNGIGGETLANVMLT